MWNRAELKEDSKSLLKLNYLPFVLAGFVHAIAAGSFASGNSSVRAVRSWDNFSGDGYYGYDEYAVVEEIADYLMPFLGIALLTAAGMWTVMLLVNVFLLSPLEAGCKRYMILSREVKPQYQEMIFAFKNCYGNVVKTMFLKKLYVFLWSLLFIIPGFVKSYEYRMVPYLMAEYPDMASYEAFHISREMMMGNKWEAFVLDLSFFGWNLLSAITLGLSGIFYSDPYQLLTNCALYLTLKRTHPSFGYVPGDDNYYFQK